MKIKSLFTLGLIILHSAFCLSARAQGSSLNSFTYQGRLNDTNGPASGLYDFSFALFPASTGGSQVGTTITRGFVPVTNGLFTVPLEFLDANSFSGADRWLEIAVHPSGVGTNITLSPRQQITAAPYAIRAANLSGPLPLSQLPAGVVTNNGSGVTLAGTFTGNGAGLLNVNATTLGGLSSAGFWKTNGNAGANPTNGAFLGTTDNLPVEIRVNGARALRLEPTEFPEIMNVVGGSPRNLVTNGAVGATIWGGGADEISDYGNTVAGTYGTVSGGRQNSANNAETTVAGGRANTASGLNSTVSGGYANTVSGAYGSIGGGIFNLLTSADHATIGGGYQNTIQSNAYRGTVGGGFVNTVGAPEGTVAGGAFNSALGFSATIGGGGGNAASGDWSIIAGGRDNQLLNAPYATIGGGYLNAIQTNADFATIGGGLNNTIQPNALRSTVSGGSFNTVHSNAQIATISGGEANIIEGFSQFATIGGGRLNVIQSSNFSATIAGGEKNVVNANASFSSIGGGLLNSASSEYANLGGGLQNTVQSDSYHTVISGGAYNNIRSNSWRGTIGGGAYNSVGGPEGTVAGGAFNSALGFSATIGGGGGNAASGDWSIIAGGRDNQLLNAPYATISGGLQNTIQPNAFAATIPGGWLNSAIDFGFAAGRRAKANHTGAFVWADATDADFASTGANQFNVRASGGVRLETGGAGMTLDGFNVLSGIVPSASLAGTYSGTVVFNNSGNSFTGNGANLTALNASQLTSGTVPDARLSANVSLLGSSIASAEIVDGTIAAVDVNAPSFNTTFWRTVGNAGTTPGTHFLGTTDNLPMEIRVNGARALRLEPNTNGAPNVIGGSPSNSVAASVEGATIAGGGLGLFPNKITASYATIGGGTFNTVAGGWATIGGGRDNIASGAESTVPGGRLNTASGQYSTAMGADSTASGQSSTAMGQGSTASGGASSAIGNLTRASGLASIALGNNTTASGQSSTAMGEGSTASGIASTAMGRGTMAINDDATAMGFGSIASGWDSVAMGTYTVAGGHYSFSAGYYAQATNQGSFVWADSTSTTPFASTANNQFLIRAAGGVGIGTASPQASLHVYSANNPTVLRLQSSAQPGAGRIEFLSDPQGGGSEWRPGYIQSTDKGGFTGGLSFVVNGTGNRFGEVETMRIVDGRVGIGTPTPVSELQVIGTVTATTFNPPSDRNLKENFLPVSPRDVLEKIAAMPISRWNFKGDASTPHVGPMAQDFHAAFGLGTDNKHIATVDADGVALAAIQGLNQKLEEKLAAQQSAMHLKETRLNTLEKKLADLEKLLAKLSTQGN